MASNAESEEEFEFKPFELHESASTVKVDLIPKNSKEIYWKEYDIFIQWKDSKKVKVISQNVMLAYFQELSKKYSPTSIWKSRSMLKSTLLIKHGIRLDDFHELTALLKNLSKNYKCKKSKVLTSEEIKLFLKSAPNNVYLVTKVALVLGLYGACRHSELLNLTIDNVVDLSQIIKVILNDTKNNKSRTFFIEGEHQELIRSYIALRPEKTSTNRFFLRYADNKCYNQPIGKNKIGAMPRVIARFLKLEESHLYTGHSFRRSSATVAADSGMSMTDLKRLGGWTSTSVARSYIEESIHNKKKASENISDIIAEVSQENISIEEPEPKRARLDEDSSLPLSENIQNVLSLSSHADRIALNIPNSKYELGGLLNEGKTKKVYALLDDRRLCYLESKDRITAGDGVKSHELEGKAAISNATNAKVFQLLNQAGLKTAFVKLAGEKAFISKYCEMVPIEWVTRRLATGSFLKRNPGVMEGHCFNPPLQETFFKDDADHDPQWSEAQILAAGFNLNGVTIGKDEYDIMLRTARVVFEVLERAWATRDCALIDMKIEFGIDADGEILVADIIDSDSWRLWPSGDKRLMKDKQVYRNLSTVTHSDLETVKRNFKWVADQLDFLVPPPSARVVILMGSASDEAHCRKIAEHAEALGLKAQLRVCSAHKGTEETIRILAEYEGSGDKVVLVAVAGRSNGLGPVLSGNTPLPVINCPPGQPDDLAQDVWSSLKVPSGLGCTTVLYPESAALAAAQIHALHDYLVWSRLRVKQLMNFITLKKADANLRN